MGVWGDLKGQLMILGIVYVVLVGRMLGSLVGLMEWVGGEGGFQGGQRDVKQMS